MQTEYHILNLGAGVQSTTLYLMFLRGEIQPKINYAIFADTQEEPEQVYKHLEWLQSLNGTPILVRTKGKLGDDLVNGVNSTGQRLASIPAFTKGDGDGQEGRTRRQCSKEYKVDVIERAIRRDILGLLPGLQIPKTVLIHQYFGISADEAGRSRRIQARRESKRVKCHFPLLERFMTRSDCLQYLEKKVPHQTPRSACVFCPYHSDAEWDRIRTEDPEGWRRALEVDQALRVPGNIVNRNMDKPLYLHRSCKPLEEIEFDTRPRFRDLQMNLSFWSECEGMCGV